MNLLGTGIILDMLKRHQFKPGYISPIILIEILRGIDSEKRPQIKERLEKSFSTINIDDNIIESYCELYRQLKQEGALLPDADLLIAATAIAHNLPLETNDDHFQRLRTLGLELTI